MAITAKQLAALLGLSEAAVSLALNDKPGVSNLTRKRVFEAAKQHGYDFSRRGALSMDKHRSICFAIYKKSGAVVSDTPFFSTLMDGVSMGCRREGYECVIRYLFEDDDLEDQIVSLCSSGFSGMIVLATEMMEATLQYFDTLNFPVVFMDAYFERPEYNYVLINNLQGAYMATAYLIRKCGTQPGYLHSSYWISNFEQRADGFYKAIRSEGMSASQSVVHLLSPSQEGAYGDMKKLLDSGIRPAQCYFADNDLIAIGAIQAFKEAGYRIPEDISVVGFDDSPACECMVPALTTILVPKLFLGETAVARLLQLIEGKCSRPLKLEVSTTLIKRKSVFIREKL